MKPGLFKKLSNSVLFLFFFLIMGSVFAQSDKGKKPKPNPPRAECEGVCFSTQVVSATINANCCTDYVLRVSHDATCRYELSHFTVALPCGTVSNLSNSGGFKNEIGKDPTTGLYGFKVDDINNFGKKGDNSFTVNVTVCADSSCLEKISVVAYKAGQCVDYDTLTYSVSGSCGSNGGGDTTATCSTLSASIRVAATSCFNSSDGELEVSVQKGKEPFTYSWSTGATTPMIQNLAAGIYSVTVKDADGNVLTLNKEVTRPPDLTITETVFNPSCSGSANGSINISPSGGSGSYSFQWSNGATTEDINNLNAGTYTVTVTDSAGCSKQASYLLLNNVRITLTGAVTKASCGQSDGAVNVSISGGTTPYTYSWSNGETTEDIQNLVAGTYRLTVTDAFGCSSSGTFIVAENNTLRTDFTVSHAGCFNEATGAIDITVTGGTAPYTYSWQNGTTTQDLSGLVSGIYRITVTDNAGCSLQTAINVPKKSIQVVTEIAQPLCSGDSTGSITVTPVDGSTTYTYSWSNGGTSNTITDVPVGSYTVTVTDASGCSRTLSYSITQPAAISATAVVSNAQCGDEGNFAVDLSVTGGKTPYSYLWSNGATTQDLTTINSGIYSVVISDASQCTYTKEVVVSTSQTSFTCLINAPMITPICSSVGNTITTSILDAQQYQWSVTSSDNSWSITAGATTASVVYTAGSSGSTATFTVTIVKNGCSRTCSYVVASGCVPRDNNGGGDPSSGDPCESDTTIVNNPPPPPPTEEPTTNDPKECVFRISVYPNPFHNDLTFKWTSDKNDYVRLEILNMMGWPIKTVYAGQVRRGETYKIELTDLELRHRIYFYRYTSSSKSRYGKLFRK